MLFLDQVEGITQEKIFEKVKHSSNTTLVLLAETEWECNFGGKETVDKLKELNIQLKIVHGSFRDERYENLYKSWGLNIENVFFWNTFWINFSEFQLNFNVDYKSYVPSNQFKYPFICLNNRSHIQRCATVEELAKTNLISKGVVTWHDFLNENSDYPFKYFDRTQKRTLSDNFAEKLDSFLIAKEFKESFFHLITEATINATFITEKTATALLFQKPFVVVADKGFHHKLQTLGFKLYDELIDYSFDDEPDLHKRVEMIVGQLPKIIDGDWTMMYQLLKPKLDFNFNRAIEIIEDNSYIPSIIKELAKVYENDGSFNYRNKTFIHRTKKMQVIPIWHDDHSIFLDEIKNNSHVISEILMDSLSELDCTYSTPFFEQCIDLANSLNLPVTVISPFDFKINSPLPRMTTPQWNSTKLISWPLFWIVRTFNFMSVAKNRELNISRGMDIYNKNVCLDSESFRYLYITMNNLAKNHRCLMMDLLAKHNLIDSGAIAWRDIRRNLDSVRHLIPDGMTDSEYDGYPYQYWKPKLLFLDQGKDTLFHQESLPVEYKHSFMQIVTETDDVHFLVSEKTAVPLIFNKPFLVAGCPNFHKTLETFGFKLYDEIFDYSFDSENDIRVRYDGIAENVARLRSQNLTELFYRIREKLVFNRNLALSYVFDKWPDEIRPIIHTLQRQSIQSSLSIIFGINGHKNELY